MAFALGLDRLFLLTGVFGDISQDLEIFLRILKRYSKRRSFSSWVHIRFLAKSRI